MIRAQLLEQRLKSEIFLTTTLGTYYMVKRGLVEDD